MSAGKFSFTIEQGATTDFEIIFKDSNGVPVNLRGREAAMQIRNLKNGPVLFATLTSSLGDTYSKNASGSFLSLSGSSLTDPLSSGSIGVYIGHAVTNEFTFDEAFYDLELTNGQERIRLIEGKVRNTSQVTLINPKNG
tara:strand:- start:1225 stop:1641 length:417 start_codon:yes stop_codon:yes gene_type:complete